MRAYSVDLRERIVEAVKEEKLSKVAVAERYQVSRASVYRYLGLEKQGSVEAKRRPGQKQRLNAELGQKLLEQLEENSDASLEEHAELLYKEQGVRLKKSSIANYFARLGVRRKKDLAPERT